VNLAITQRAGELAPRALAELEALVAISTPFGDSDAAELAFSVCREALPAGTAFERVPCSTSGCAPDLIARIAGSGSRRLMLLGHVDTVIPHSAHRPVERDGERLYGSGAADMKSGVAVSLALARELAASPEDFAELALLLVCDEEWRTAPFSHVGRFAGYDACLCFEAGERVGGPDGYQEGVIVRRKGAGMLRVLATGRAAHSGSAPQDGRNALLALAHTAIDLSAMSDAAGPDRLTVVPTIVESGSGLNVVPAAGELVFDMRADDTAAFGRVIEALTSAVDGVTLEARLERVWPAMDSGQAAAGVIAAAAKRLGAPIVPRARGGASDASHFAPKIPVTMCGLGPRGGGAHTPEEFIHVGSVAERLAVSLAIAGAALSC
jgi:glutamate carboxypeptidase